MSESLNLFEAEALAPGVTVQTADYELFSVDAGFKYRGWFVAAELYRRTVDRLVADGPLPIAVIEHGGYYLQTSHMIVPKKMGRVSLDEERAICAAISRACRSPARRAELADD